jgi:plastocyanin
MTSHNSNSWRLFSAVIGGFAIGLFALLVWAHMAQQVFAGVAADVTDIDLMKRSSATMAIGNAAYETGVQKAAAASQQSGAKISIVNFAFTPAEITIRPGESVTWANDDGATHGLKFHDGAKGTDLLLPGATFSRRFDRAATYDYDCAVHPYMTGRVVVRSQ